MTTFHEFHETFQVSRHIEAEAVATRFQGHPGSAGDSTQNAEWMGFGKTKKYTGKLMETCWNSLLVISQNSDSSLNLS